MYLAQFEKFSIEDVHMVLSIGDFHENWCNESHTAMVLITFYLFLKTVRDCELCEIWCSENCSLLNDVIHFCLYFAHCVISVNCGVRCLNIMLLAFMSSMKVGTRKTAFRMVVYEITFMHVL